MCLNASLLTRVVCLAAAASLGLPSLAMAQNAKRHALLVGCTKYDNREKLGFADLVGPANDVKLFRDLLVGRFGFQDVVTLAEAEGGATRRPTYANIKSEFERLISVTKNCPAGTQVVILLGGHGTQEPNERQGERNYDASDSEPDGLDEAFLPADLAGWSADQKELVNAVRDDELRKWLGAIRANGASVWIIIDACHSGTMVRGGDDVIRQIPPDRLIPKEALAAVQASTTRGSGTAAEPEGGLVDGSPPQGNSPVTNASPSPRQGKLVAIYAAQSTEPTVERPMPYYAKPGSQVSHGILTFTINMVLTQAASPITYGELMQRVQQLYTAWGRQSPTPLAEGDGLALEVMGTQEWPGRSQMRLQTLAGELTVNAGSLHGLTNGTILAVFPPAGDKAASARAGFAKINDVSTLQSYVSPCDEKGQPATSKLPENGRVEVFAIDYAGLQSLKVGIETVGQGAAAAPILAEIKSHGAFPEGLINFQPEPKGADWVVRTMEGKAYLVPSGGWAVARGLQGVNRDVGSPGTEYGPFSLGGDGLKQLAENLGRIARVQSVLKLAPTSDTGALAASGIKIKLELRRHAGRGDLTGQVIDLSAGAPTLKSGDMVGFHVTNEGRTAVDVSLLFIDAGYGITPWFPKSQTVTDNRLAPNATLAPPDVPRAIISDNTTGVERLVLLAVKAEGPPLDFTWLSQESIATARSTRGGPESPLTKLFEFAAYRGTRGPPISAEGGISPFAMRTISWKVPLPAESGTGK